MDKTPSFLKEIFDLGIDAEFLSTEGLLAVAVISSAVAGAAILGLREKRPMNLKNLLLGLATGFIVFLAIKGGKTIFMVSKNHETMALNDYNCAFAALLAGLFTEKMYGILSNAVTLLTGRIEQALGENPSSKSN